MTERAGFVGLGNMGAPMAGRLLDAGYSLAVFDVREPAARELVARGAEPAVSPEAVGSAAKTVFLSLPTPEIVRQVVLGPSGLVAGTEVRTIVDLSTTGPQVAGEIACALSDRGIAMLDSPVSGGVGGARRGTLAIMVSGPRERFEALRPMLDVIGRVFYLGDKPGLGQAMKLINNLLSAAALAISSEAIVMGVKVGLDPETMLAVINAGSGRNTATEDKFPRAILPRTFDYGFATGLMCKDLRLCHEVAVCNGVPMPVADAVRGLWFVAEDRFGSGSDFTTIVRCAEESAGVEVRRTT